MGRTSLITPAARFAAAATAVIGSIAITGMALSAHPATAAASSVRSAPSGPPRYYADVEGEGSSIVIRATATSQVTATYRPSRYAAIGALAAAGGNRVYFVDDSGTTAPPNGQQALAAARGGPVTGSWPRATRSRWLAGARRASPSSRSPRRRR